MVMLGIDPGYQFAGFGILKKENNKAFLLDHGFLRLPPSKSLVERTGLFYDFFNQKIGLYSVDHLSLETPFLGKNAQNFLKLGYLRGILYLLASQHKLKVHEFAPRQVKLALTGYGAASKEQVAHVIMRLFPNLTAPDKTDVTDALAVTLCGVWQHNNVMSKLRI